jgi:hypothetical protein
MPKPKIYIDYDEQCIKMESDKDNKISVTEAHSFIKDFISVAYDYFKYFPQNKLGDYIK